MLHYLEQHDRLCDLGIISPFLTFFITGVTTWRLKALLCLKVRIGPTQEVNNFSSNWFSNISFSHSCPWKINICDEYGKGYFNFCCWWSWIDIPERERIQHEDVVVEYSLELEEFKGRGGVIECLITVSNGTK